MTTYFTSDTHFRHKNILEFTDRPYSTIEEMESNIIHNWNREVCKTDTVYLLGDFCFGNYTDWIEILNQLRGNIILIKGNHDKIKIINKVYKDEYLQGLYMVGELLTVEKFALNITHYPMFIGNRTRNYSIHGHIHSQQSDMINQINIGVDSPFAKRLGKPFGTPISLDELMTELKDINPKLEDKFLSERECNDGNIL